MQNGAMTVTKSISLTLKAKRVGSCKIGPVTVKTPHEEITGTALYVNVEAAKPKSLTRSKIFDIEIVPAKKEVFWGEPLVIALRYFQTDAVLDYDIILPEHSNFIKKEIKEIDTRPKLHGGTIQRARVHELTLIPVKAGICTVGPMRTVYRVRVEQVAQNSLFALMFSNMVMVENREITIPPVEIRVKPLPKNKENIALVGDITGLELTVDKATAQVNDPIKLSVNITGYGNLEFTEMIPLTLPAGCKVFKSKSSLHNHPGGKGIATKTIEYVLQANVAGQIQIPAQKLGYFDPVAEIYKSVSSQPVDLFLTGDPVAQPTKSVDELAREVTNEPTATKKPVEAFVFEDAGRHQVKLDWWLMVLFMFAPLCLHVRTIINWLHSLHARFKKAPTRSEILKEASHELARIIAADKPEQLHQFFIKIIAQLYGVHEQDVTEIMIEERFTQSGVWTSEQIQAFINYLHTCTSLHFTRQTITPTTRSAVLEQSREWLTRLSTAIPTDARS
jgi:hypothetical protein